MTNRNYFMITSGTGAKVLNTDPMQFEERNHLEGKI
jgi:hypothetical protein